MALSKDDIESIDELLDVASEGSKEWGEEFLAVVDEELEPATKEDMRKDGLDDEETQDAICGVLAIKGLYLAYRTALAEIDDDDTRAYIRAKVEEAPFTPLGEESPQAKLTVVPAPPPEPKPAAPAPAPVTIPKPPKIGK